MAASSERRVWIRGPGLNSVTHPDRAEEFLGSGWETARVSGTVLRQRRGGVLHVRLDDGYTLWVNPQWVSEGPDEGTEPGEEAEEFIELAQELGSDQEEEDVAPEDEGEVEGSLGRKRRVPVEDEWTATLIEQDPRNVEGHGRVWGGQIRGLDRVSKDDIFAYFWRFVPKEELDEAISIMLQKGKSLWPEFKLDRNTFCAWLGVWFRLCAERHRTRRQAWEDGGAGKGFRDIMTFEHFRRVTSVLEVPMYEENELEKLKDMGPGPDPMQWFRKWLHSCNRQWRADWEPGTFLTVDETMVFWTGLGSAHLTYIPRKPSPLGIMVKVTCCSDSGVLLHAELVEGATVDARKEFVGTFKPTTTCTLRITKSWWGTGRVVIGDAWFGSVRTVEELRDVGLYAIMCVKQGCAGFPRAELKQQLKNRGDQKFYVAPTIFNSGEVHPVFAGGHMDKAPLLLCATTGTSLPGEKKVRYRSKLVHGNLVKSKYELEQPNMHALYRKYFNAVDRFNKASMQPGTLPDVWQTKSAWHRLFAATVSWMETNAFLAYNQSREQNDKLTKGQWYAALSDACVNNPFAPVLPRAVVEFMVGHSGLAQSKQGLCWICKHKTNWKCSCGRAICSNVTRAKRVNGALEARPVARDCLLAHLSQVQQGVIAHTGTAVMRRGPAPKV